MAIQGLRDSESFIQNERPENWREGLLLSEPNGEAPLTALTAAMKSASTDDPRFHWFEKQLADQRFALTAEISATTNTIPVESGALTLMSGHLLYAEETGEVMLVNGDPSSDTKIPVIRGYSGTTAASIDHDAAGVNPNLLVMGSTFEEGADAPTGLGYDPVERYNYTQIFRRALEATRTATKTRLRTTDQAKEAKREAFQYHTIEMERAFWLGQRWQGFRNGNPIRTTGGVFYAIEQWGGSDRVYDESGGTTDLERLEEILMDAFKWGSSEKMGWAGNRAMLTIQQIVRKNADWTFQQGLKEFGMNVSRLITPFGELVLKLHPLFNLIPGGSTGGSAYTGLNSYLSVLDMDKIRYRPFTGADTHYRPDIGDKGVDGMKSEYLTEAGLEINNPEAHTLIKGLDSAAVDD